MTVEKVGKKISNFPWAIIEDGKITQPRFATKEEANLAYHSYLMRGNR